MNGLQSTRPGTQVPHGNVSDVEGAVELQPLQETRGQGSGLPRDVRHLCPDTREPHAKQSKGTKAAELSVVWPQHRTPYTVLHRTLYTALHRTPYTVPHRTPYTVQWRPRECKKDNVRVGCCWASLRLRTSASLALVLARSASSIALSAGASRHVSNPRSVIMRTTHGVTHTVSHTHYHTHGVPGHDYERPTHGIHQQQTWGFRGNEQPQATTDRLRRGTST